MVVACPNCNVSSELADGSTAFNCPFCSYDMQGFCCRKCGLNFAGRTQGARAKCTLCGETQPVRSITNVPLESIPRFHELTHPADGNVLAKPLFTCRVIDATGWAPQVGESVGVVLGQNGLQLVGYSESRKRTEYSVSYSDLEQIIVQGFSKTNSAGVFGGGFGFAGAAEGMAIAALVNRLTARSKVWVVVTMLAKTGRAVLFLDGASEEMVKRLFRNAQDAILESANNSPQGDMGASTGASDIVSRLERLAQLRDNGALSDDEFQKAKARLFE